MATVGTEGSGKLLEVRTIGIAEILDVQKGRTRTSKRGSQVWVSSGRRWQCLLDSVVEDCACE